MARKLLLAVGLGTALIGGSELYEWRKTRGEKPADSAPAARAWRAAERCLFGGPRRQGELFSERVNVVRALEDDTWPARCAVHLERLRRALEAVRIEPPTLFEQAVSELEHGGTSQLENVMDDLSWRFDDAPPADVSDVRAPAIEPLLDPVRLAPLPLEYYESDRMRGRSLRLAPNVEPRHACVFDDPKRGRCVYLPDAIAASIEYPELVDGDEGTLPAFSTNRGIIDVFTGRTLLEGASLRRAYVGIDGRVTAMLEAKTLLRTTPEGMPEKVRLPPKLVDPTLLSSSWLLALMPGSRSPAHDVRIDPILPDKLALGTPIVFKDLAASPSSSSAISSCTTRDAAYVWLREEGKLLILERGSWKLVDGAPKSEAGRLSCDGAAGYMVAIADQRITQTRCTSAGCSERGVALPKDPPADKATAVVVGDRVLLVRWKDGLAFLTVGSIDQIAKARPQLLFSLRLIHDIDLFPRGDAALGLVTAMDLRRLVFVIHQNGKAEPIAIRDTP